MLVTYDTSGTRKEVLSRDELSKAVYDSIDYYEARCNRLIEENKRLKDAAREVVYEEFKDELTRLKDELHLSYGSFSSQKELDAYNDFTEQHMHDRLTSRYNGGRAPYLIPTGTGIGVILHVKCPICGEEKDITDDSVW